MKPPRRGSSGFLLSSVDRYGRAIDPMVLAVAREIGPRAVAYADKLLVDTALAMNLFEEAAAAVSETLRRKPTGAAPVRDLSAYLYRAFLRKVNLARTKHARLETSLRNQARSEAFERQPAEPEIALLFDEVMATYDKVNRQIVYRRLEGFSWKEIAAEFGLSTHATEARYSRALAKARVLLGIRRRTH